MPLSLYYAVKPLRINQKFGENPDYYAKFGWKGHNGIDFFAPHATPLYAPCDGQAFYTTDLHGGDGIYIRTKDDQNKPYTIILWHLCSKDDPVYHPLIPMDGSTISVKAGALIAYTDNTGAPYESSGDHLHFGLIPTQPNFNPIDPYNGFGGCIDPLPFFNGLFAQDIPIDQQVLSAASKVISLSQNPAFPTSLTLQIIQKVEDFLNQLFTFIQ